MQITKKRSSLFWLLLAVPLIAAAGWQDEITGQTPKQVSKQDRQTNVTLPGLIYDSSEHFSSIDSANLDGLLNRIGDSRLVLLGEATHGTAEFYDMRARITRELIEKKGFNIIAVEADWPDAVTIDQYIQRQEHRPDKKSGYKIKPFSDFPRWMWANHSVLAFTRWLKNYNQSFNSDEETVRFYGLDFYNMFGSIEAVLNYLQEFDPEAAEAARWSYGCLKPWVDDPALYSRDMQSGRYRGSGQEVTAVLQELRNKRDQYIHRGKESDKQQFFSAEQNARLVRNGERYYRTMYNSDSNSWNQRDQNMFETLQEILHKHGQTSKAVVWAHNSHIGDASATEVSTHGEINIGQLVRKTFGDSAYLIGFGTDHGTVLAASKWGGPMKVMQVQAAHRDSYEHQFHDVKTDNFMLPLSFPIQDITRQKLLTERLQRAIGTTYDPENELQKHYIYASLPHQFDEYIWFDETRAVEPFSKDEADMSPFNQ